MATRCPKSGKIKYHSRFEADLAISSLERHVKKHRKHKGLASRDLPVRSYRCEHCSSWHHTSQEPRSKSA